MTLPDFLDVVDSHTEGEPTRVVVSGGPPLGDGPLSERVKTFRENFDAYRSAMILEPRGSDVLVGALLVDPVETNCAAGVIFFNNTGYLGMCGHGTIGVVATLAHLGRIEPGTFRLETPVGTVTCTWHGNGRASIENVPSYRYRRDVTVEVPDYGTVRGDIAWGGNWFFLVKDSPERLTADNVQRLTDITLRIRAALEASKITGKYGGLIDHIELSGPPVSPDADSRNFVLCPGGAYDRSPCGTGTSAKLACLMADGAIQAGQVWRQESIIGSIFEGVARWNHNLVIPTIVGRAFIVAESRLVFDPRDPFREGIRT
ncbi:MAG: proline racemase family protein [Pirellulaceae bacterium]|nr:proline racemase family protein [Planctomycetales bacterium]